MQRHIALMRLAKDKRRGQLLDDFLSAAQRLVAADGRGLQWRWFSRHCDTEPVYSRLPCNDETFIARQRAIDSGRASLNPNGSLTFL
ncbi:MAG: hypothetical protein ABIH23_14485 [bacterium]